MSNLRATSILRKLRGRRGLTLDVLSEKSGIPCSSICRYETGESVPRLDAFIVLCEALGVEPWRVLRTALKTGDVQAVAE